MLAAPDGARRVLIFVILVVCVDVGGYFAGGTLGRHPMAQAISPSKTWEGLAGSVLLCLIAGAVTVPLLLHGHVWQGLLTGAEQQASPPSSATWPSRPSSATSRSRTWARSCPATAASWTGWTACWSPPRSPGSCSPCS